VLLIDTCSFIWLTSDPSRLSKAAAQAIESEQELYLSDVCVWEICLKWQAKKIGLPTPPRGWISEQMSTWSFLRAPIEPEHLFRTTELPDYHRDPFDRLLIAQALANSARILTPDAAIRQYPVSVVW
jgi:PIN domain nuclease of toxin-antitoxin system